MLLHTRHTNAGMVVLPVIIALLRVMLGLRLQKKMTVVVAFESVMVIALAAESLHVSTGRAGLDIALRVLFPKSSCSKTRRDWPCSHKLRRPLWNSMVIVRNLPWLCAGRVAQSIADGVIAYKYDNVTQQESEPRNFPMYLIKIA